MISLGGVVIYLLVGVLAGENLRLWVTWLPESARWWSLELFAWAHTYNPFAVMHYWFDSGRIVDVALNRMLGVEAIGLGLLGLISLRGSASPAAIFTTGIIGR